MNKHTPGPWYVADTKIRTSINSEHKHIAMVNYSYRGIESDVMGEEHEANARLIAAAPDLLAALQGLLRGIFDGPDEADAAMLIAKARDAVNKAIGKD